MHVMSCNSILGVSLMLAAAASLRGSLRLSLRPHWAASASPPGPGRRAEAAFPYAQVLGFMAEFCKASGEVPSKTDGAGLG